MQPRYSLMTAIVLLAAVPALCQTTIGYTDPDDTTALLDYRLPDWGWSEWSGYASLNGDGSDDGTESRNSNRLSLSMAADWFRDGETLAWEFYTGAGLSWSSSSSDGPEFSSDQDRLMTRVGFDGNARRYLGSTSFYALGGGGLEWNYGRSYTEEDPGGAFYEAHNRWLSMAARTGVGFGRLRNVTPLISAQRISERLVTLGRRALTRAQVQQVAEALARQSGYWQVYERDERRFWHDVLAPVLEPGRPLTLHEVLYLREVERERRNERFEGTRVEVRGQWEEDRHNNDVGDDQRFRSHSYAPHVWTAEVGADWAHNLSLTSQVRVSGSVDRHWVSFGGRTSYESEAAIQASWLYDLTDRNQLFVEFGGTGSHNEWDGAPIRRSFTGRLEISDRYWLEDRLTLEPRVTVWRYAAEEEKPQTEWQYEIAFRYIFGAGLY